MKQFYKGNKVFNYTDYKDLKGYVSLTKDSKVKRISRSGPNKIIKYYFKNNVFDYQKYQVHFEAVVSKLFDYGVLISMVDNGQFGIVYKSECNLKK